MRLIEKRPLVTIAVPTRNRSKLLKETLRKLLKQTYKNIEIIISDNLSNDGTQAVVKSIIDTSKHVKYYRQKKLLSGIDNMNFILKKAKGAYFMMASDDDTWDVRYVELLMKDVKVKDDTFLITSKFQIIDKYETFDHANKWSFARYKKKYLSFRDFLYEDFSAFKTGFFYGIYNTEKLKKIGGYLAYPALSAPDFITMHTVLSKGKVRIVDRILFYKRENITHPKNFNLDLKAGVERGFKRDFLLAVRRISSNLLPRNLLYIVTNVFIYYKANRFLIKTHWHNNIILHYLNLRSSYHLFMALFPNDIQLLRKRNATFTSKKLLKKYNLL